MVGARPVSQEEFYKLQQDIESIKTMLGTINLSSEFLDRRAGKVEIDLKTIKETLENTFPIGSILLFGGSKAPDGWLVCDGSVVLRANYPALFEVIGETYGKGDGHNTFSLPDLRGRTAIGTGEGSGFTTRLLGEKIGLETNTLTVAQLPSHAHSGGTLDNGNHTHGGQTINSGAHAHNGVTGYANPKFTRTVSQPGNRSDTNHEAGWTGENNARLQDYLNHNNFSNAKHTHNFTTDTQGNHVHGLTINQAGAHKHAIPAEGGGQPYSVMQPSLVLNYIIKY